MVGFVGVQARRRRRNKIIIYFLIILIAILFFYLPSIDYTRQENNLPDEILPDIVEDKSSILSEIEELKLKIFQKDQRIKFRDTQIKELKEELSKLKQSFKTLQIQYNNSLVNVSELQNEVSDYSIESIDEVKKLKNNILELNKIIKNYKDETNILKQKVNDSVSLEDLENISIENSILKNEIKIIKQKKLATDKILDELKLLIEEKQNKIDELLYLKDIGHHG